MEERIKKNVKEATESFVMHDLLDKLGTKIIDGGCSAFDEFRHTYGSAKNRNREHSYNRWRARDRSSELTSSFTIENRASYAKYLYSDTPSEYHKRGWRSSGRHKPVKYRGQVLTRSSQVTKRKWEKCVESMQKKFNRIIKKAVGKKR